MSEENDPYAKWADDYDAQGLKSQWHGPALLFGMMYPYIRSGQSMLELGIGTGLGALSFHRAGLKVTGLDSSPSMLAKARQRGETWELHQHDLTNSPWPVDTDSIDHVVTTGVTHFIGNLRTIMSETSRVMKTGGIFAFDFDEYKPGDSPGYEEIESGVYETYDSQYDVRLYRHTEEYIMSNLTDAGFEVIHGTAYLASRERQQWFRAIVARLQ